MAKYFKIKTNYLQKDIESETGVSKVSEIRLFEAVDYVDAQEQAIKIINTKGCCGECDIEIQRVSYDFCLYKKTKENAEEETYWYEIRITRIVEDDKENEKYVITKYLIEGIDLEDAIDEIREYLKDEDENYWWFTSIQETPIQEVIISKEENCLYFTNTQDPIKEVTISNVAIQ